jgi:hypothetical protein
MSSRIFWLSGNFVPGFRSRKRRFSMKKLTGALVALSAVIAMTACNREKTDDELIREAVMNSDYFSARTVEGGPTLYTMDTSDYLTWWRVATSHPDPYLEIRRVDDSAYVVFSGKAVGDFHIAFWGKGEYTKPFADSATIEGVVQKNDAGEWEVTHVSGVHWISCGNPPSYTIDSVWITIGGVDTVITDPLNLFALDSVLTFTVGSDLPIKCKAYTSTMNLDGALHLFGQDEHYRLDFVDSGAFFFAQDTVGLTKPGVHFLGVDLFDKACLMYADTAYECRGWLIPFNVK